MNTDEFNIWNIHFLVYEMNTTDKMYFGSLVWT